MVFFNCHVDTGSPHPGDRPVAPGLPGPGERHAALPPGAAAAGRAAAAGAAAGSAGGSCFCGTDVLGISYGRNKICSGNGSIKLMDLNGILWNWDYHMISPIIS